jgi:hypothetical protein
VSAVRPEPTEKELRAAFEHHRARRPAEWPEDFHEAMAHPTLSRLVRITAMHPPTALRQQLAFSTGLVKALRPAPGRRYRAVPAMDRKRAAAGEREDD